MRVPSTKQDTNGRSSYLGTRVCMYIYIYIYDDVSMHVCIVCAVCIHVSRKVFIAAPNLIKKKEQIK